MKQRNTAWARKVIGGTLLLLSVVATVLVPRPTFAGENGQQLVIKLPAGYKMTHLRIEGTFYTDENVVWDHALSPSNVYFLKDWWWKDTVLLQFNVKGLGTVACVVDYVPEQQKGDWFLVQYYGPGHGCSSASSVSELGGVFNADLLVQELENKIALDEDTESLDNASNLLEGKLLEYVSDQVFSPPCLMRVALAVPPGDGNTVPLTSSVMKMCEKEANGLNAILSLFGRESLIIEDQVESW
jgi:hypothetical protein